MYDQFDRASPTALPRPWYPFEQPRPTANELRHAQQFCPLINIREVAKTWPAHSYLLIAPSNTRTYDLPGRSYIGVRSSNTSKRASATLESSYRRCRRYTCGPSLNPAASPKRLSTRPTRPHDDPTKNLKFTRMLIFAPPAQALRFE